MDPFSFVFGGVTTVILVVVFEAFYRYTSEKTRTDTTTTDADGSDTDSTTQFDDEKLPAQLAILVLLEANDSEGIQGITRIQKLVFLLQEEWENHMDEPYQFEKYEFDAETY